MQTKKFKEQRYWDSEYSKINISEIENVEQIHSFYSLYSPPREFFYVEYFFYKLVRDIKNKRILNIGGGIDRISLYLAKKGNRVFSIDVSKEAVEKTNILAKKIGVGNNLNAYQLDWENEELREKFDIVITHDVLHHLDFTKAVSKIYDILNSGGRLISLEPVCLLSLVRFIHKKFIFHPYPLIIFYEGEKELSMDDINFLKAQFKNVKFNFFDVFTRESIFYFLYKAGLRKALKILGWFDFLLIRAFPLFKYLSSHVVFEAYK